MSPAEIEVFLKAKQQIRWVQRAQAIIVVTTALGVAAAVAGFGFDLGDDASMNLFFGFVLGGAISTALGGRTNRTRDKLVELLERQINRDPEALRYLAAADRAR